MTVLSKYKSQCDVINYFKELPFYNKSVKKPKVKRLKDVHQLIKLPFYEQLDVIKTDKVFKGSGMSYKVQIVGRKDPIVQLKASKLSIKKIFNDILNKRKGSKYQTTVKALLKEIQARWRN